MSKILDQWDAEAKGIEPISTHCSHCNNRIIQLISLMRAKDEALDSARVAMQYAYEDHSDQYYKAKERDIIKALSLTEELGDK